MFSSAALAVGLLGSQRGHQAEGGRSHQQLLEKLHGIPHTKEGRECSHKNVTHEQTIQANGHSKFRTSPPLNRPDTKNINSLTNRLPNDFAAYRNLSRSSDQQLPRSQPHVSIRLHQQNR